MAPKQTLNFPTDGGPGGSSAPTTAPPKADVPTQDARDLNPGGWGQLATPTSPDCSNLEPDNGRYYDNQSGAKRVNRAGR